MADCGKIPYWSKSKAKRASKRAASMHGGRPMEPFECPRCGLWHVGHSSLGVTVPCRTCQAPIILGIDDSRNGMIAPLEPDSRLSHHHRVAVA